MSNILTGHYIALFGAFERDNFGDILFLLITRKLLYPLRIIPLSLVSRDMQQEGAGEVVSFSAWFDCCGVGTPAAVVVVGGQVLNLSLEKAFLMDLPDDCAKTYLTLRESEKASLAKCVCWRVGPKAYIPDVKKIERERKNKIDLIVNSIGGIRSESANFGHLKEILSNTKFFSVRDRDTCEIIEQMFGFRPRLAPDVVSLFPSVFDDEISIKTTDLLRDGVIPSEPYVLFQASSDFLQKYSGKALVNDLTRIVNEMGRMLILMPAGLAFSHDSIDDLCELRGSIIRKVKSERSVSIFRDPNALSKVAAIGRADGVVATSLHVRILAAAFGKFRVSLQGRKVFRYVETWEKGLQPVDVTAGEIFDAYVIARRSSPKDLLAHAESMRILTEKSFETLKENLPKKYDQTIHAKIDDELEKVRIKAFCRESEVYRQEMVRITKELSKKSQELNWLEKRLPLRLYKHLFGRQ